MYLHTPVLEVGSWWRVDTASGTNTPTTVYAHDGADAIPTALGASGSTVRGNTRDGTGLFWSSAATLYCKELTYQGVPTGTVVTSAGVTPTTPAPGVGAGGVLTERGTWTTATHYSLGDVVSEVVNGQRYASASDHTSGTFATDLAAGKWTTTGTSKGYVDAVTLAGAPDATTTSKGILRLAGDLAGTATTPTVPGLAGKVDTTTRGAASGVASLDSSTLVPTAQMGTGTADSTKVLQGDRSWIAAVRLAQSASGQDPVGLGSVAVGTGTTAARSDHVHPATTIGAPMKVSGGWKTPVNQGGSWRTDTAINTLFAVPMMLWTAETWDRVGTNVSTGAASQVLRCGVYADTGNGYPGTLIADFGTIDCSGTGDKTITISQAMPAGLVWLASAVQGASGANISVMSAQPAYMPHWVTATPFTFGLTYCFSQASVSGALPGAFSATVAPTGATTPRLWARTA